MFQMKVPQLRSSNNLLTMFPRASPSALLPQMEVSSALSREFIDSSNSSVGVGSCWLSLFLLGTYKMLVIIIMHHLAF